MGLFDFLKKKGQNGSSSGDSARNAASSKQSATTYETILIEIINEALISDKGYALMSFAPLKAFQPIAILEINEKKKFLFYSIGRITTKTAMGSPEWKVGMRLIGFLLKEDLKLNDDDLLEISSGFKRVLKGGSFLDVIPVNTFISLVEDQIKKKGINDAIEKALLNISLKGQQTFLSPTETKRETYINFLLFNNGETNFDKHDRWGKQLQEFFKTLNNEEKSSWVKLFDLGRQAGNKSEPSNKWMKECAAVIESIGASRYAEKLIEWLTLVKEIIKDAHHEQGRHDFLRDENHNILKGLIWGAGSINHAELNAVLDDYAGWAYKKKPGFGPVSIKTGSACMFAFSQLPLKEGVSRLSKFKAKIKNNSILKSIDRFIRNVSEANGVSEQELEELSVPGFGINKGVLTMEFGDILAMYTVEDRVLTWEKNGKKQKSVPAEIKESYAAGLKALKNTIKEIESLLPALNDRIEKSYLLQRDWNFAKWTELYLNHPLVSHVARKLIWHFYNEDQKAQGFFRDGKIFDVNEHELSWLNNDTHVQLWHPVGFTGEEIFAWRNFITKHKIVQPFKQAFREVYILTDAEITTELYSNRFAAHILRQHQFAALCKQRGWQYHLMGNWDSHNTPTLQLQTWGLTAQYYVDNTHDGETNPTGIFNYITTDQVRFGRDNQPIPLIDVPALAFTEVMRDVDLFVGVTSIGNDPNWQNNGTPFMNTYWQNYSFGELSESAKTREQVLRNLIPNMKIADVCSFDKKYLIVKGKIRTYKIHMGSGNILMEPNDQYLCIVPARGSAASQKVYLPFEEDNILSIILSKALMLADDQKITDTTILSQINRK